MLNNRTLKILFVSGLISGAIMLSGNPLDQWALSRNNLQFGIALATEFGIDTTDSWNMVNQLKAIPSAQLQQVSIVLYQKVCCSQIICISN